ncbi:hypothetical protein [Arhodomonas sp. AD133]|uniref:hypothetical protein n=1 Tax=Arhodomonas sp. AD133 TaxID=3415009 RepID=UPI003EB968A7
MWTLTLPLSVLLLTGMVALPGDSLAADAIVAGVHGDDRRSDARPLAVDHRGAFSHKFRHDRFRHDKRLRGGFRHHEFRHGGFRFGKFRHGHFHRHKFSHGGFRHHEFRHGRFPHHKFRQGRHGLRGFHGHGFRHHEFRKFRHRGGARVILRDGD